MNTENLNLKSRILSLEKQALQDNLLLTGVPEGPLENENNVEKKLQRGYNGQFLETIMTCMKCSRELQKFQ